MSERFQQLRLLEAMLFASAEPLGPEDLAKRLPEVHDVDALLEELASLYANRGINLLRVGKRWAFRTAADLAGSMTVEKQVPRKLSRAAIETLAIIAYHQPVTRAEIEQIRGVALSRGTLDTLLEAGWIRPKGRRRTPGKPVTWGTSDGFLDHFGLESLEALPGHEELRAAGLLDTRPAITALGARGLLPMPGEAQADAEREEEDAIDEAEAAAILAAEFGGASVAAASGDAGAEEARAETVEGPGFDEDEDSAAEDDDGDEEAPLDDDEVTAMEPARRSQ